MEETLGKRIAQHRKRLGMTQDALAEKLGVTAQAVSKWENDQSCPDITMLPKLAQIFGTTTDALLGIAEEIPAKEATVVTEQAEEHDGASLHNCGWAFKYDNSRRFTLMLAVTVLLIGVLYLLSSIFVWDVGLWDIAWPSFLLVFGLYPKISFFRLGIALIGCFFLADNFLALPFGLDSGAVIAVALLLFGGAMLVDALRKPKKPKFEFNYNVGHGSQGAKNHFHTDGDSFQLDAAFGDQTRLITMPLLKSGEINTSFGDYTVDLSGIREIAPGCRIEANMSFGDLTITVPSKFEVRCASETAFASVEFDGKPDAVPAGIIQLNASASFGQITIEYV